MCACVSAGISSRRTKIGEFVRVGSESVSVSGSGSGSGRRSGSGNWSGNGSGSEIR